MSFLIDMFPETLNESMKGELNSSISKKLKMV